MFKETPETLIGSFHKVYKANIDTLVKMFPKTFNKEYPLPLRLGVGNEVRKVTGWPRWKVHAVLAIWTARMEYVLMACSEKHRYDLDGNQNGYINDEHLDNFIFRLNGFKHKVRIAEFVKNYKKEFNSPALMNVPMNRRPNLSRFF